MHPVLMTPSGIPRSGLVCWHDLYDPTESLASVPDLSGNGYSLQLGSTAGEDTNDPSWVSDGLGLSFVTDDYCLTPTLTGVDPSAPWTVVLAGVWNLYAKGKTLWGLSTATYWHRIYRTADSVNYTRVHSYAGSDASYSTTPTLYPSYTSPVALVARANADSVMLKDMGTGSTATCTNANPAGECRIGLGCVAKSSIADGSSADSMTAYSHLFYSRALSNAEIQRIYRSLRATWQSRGVSIL